MYSPYEARYFHQLLQNLFDREGVKPDVVEYISQIHSMLALVHSGMGVALIPAAATRLNFAGLTLRTVATSPSLPVEMVCSFRSDNDNPLLDVFKRRILPGFAAVV